MTASAVEFGLIIAFIAGVITLIFYAFATTYLYEGVSLLTVFISILFLEIILSFIIKFLSEETQDLPEDEGNPDLPAGGGRFDPPV